MCKKIFTIFVLIGIIFSQSPDELYNAANISLEAGNFPEAEAGFNASLQADPPLLQPILDWLRLQSEEVIYLKHSNL